MTFYTIEFLEPMGVLVSGLGESMWTVGLDLKTILIQGAFSKKFVRIAPSSTFARIAHRQK